MRAVIQRVSRASVSVDEQVVGSIGRGLLILLAAGADDTEQDLNYLVDKTANLRIFPDDSGKMNRSILDVDGGALAISQFTLYGDCRKGRRPGFSRALDPRLARDFYEQFLHRLADAGVSPVEAGIFAANMAVELVNDGPVTLLLDSRKTF